MSLKHAPRLLVLLAAATLAACSSMEPQHLTPELAPLAKSSDRSASALGGDDRLSAASAGAGGRPSPAQPQSQPQSQPQFLFIIRRASATDIPLSSLAATLTDPASPLTLTAHSLNADVQGFLATLTLSESFHAEHTALDATYTLPLAPGTLVEDALIKTPDREIRLVVRKRDEAQAAYDAARRAGLNATLLDQSEGDRLTLHIGRLDAGQSLTATITCAQLLPWNGHAFLFQTPSFPTPAIPGTVHISAPASVSSGGLWSAERTPPGNPATPRLILYHAHLGTEDFAALVALPASNATPADLHLQTTGLSPAPPTIVHLTDLPILLIAKVTGPLHAAATLNNLPLETLEAGTVDPRPLAALWARAQASLDPTQATTLGLRYGIITPTTSLLAISLPTPATQP